MALVHARPRLWTRQEYYALADAGFLDELERYELIEGEIVVVSPQGKKDRLSIILGTDVLSGLFRETHYVCVQVPLPLGDMSEPEPDFALLPKSSPLVAEGDELANADLVLEVAHSSLLYDRNEKAALYARYGIPEYWILNLEQPCLEVYRDPRPDPSWVHGFRYTSRLEVGPVGSCAPLFSPARPVPVFELLQIRPSP